MRSDAGRFIPDEDSSIGGDNLGAFGAFGPLASLTGVRFVLNQEVGGWDVLTAVWTPPEGTIGIMHSRPPSVSTPCYRLTTIILCQIYGSH